MYLGGGVFKEAVGLSELRSLGFQDGRMLGSSPALLMETHKAMEWVANDESCRIESAEMPGLQTSSV